MLLLLSDIDLAGRCIRPAFFVTRLTTVLPRSAAAQIGPSFHADTDAEHLSAVQPFGFCHGPAMGALDLGAEASTAGEYPVVLWNLCSSIHA